MRKHDPLSPRVLGELLFGGSLGIAPSDRLVVAFSGGLDSTVLVHALAALRAVTPIDLHAIHVHHALQPEADQWADHCRQFCQRLGLSCEVLHVSVVGQAAYGTEGAARLARYHALTTRLGERDVLLTGHHADDQAETVLLQLMRGTGLAGLAGMRHSTALGPHRLVRPLLGCTRSELALYAQHHDLAWIEDPSNQDLKYARNFVRQSVLPRLRARWVRAPILIARTAAHVAASLELLEEVAREDLERALAGSGLALPVLRRWSTARLRNALRYWLRTDAGCLADARQLDRLVNLVRSVSGSGRLSWAGVDLRAYHGVLYRVVPAPVFAPLTWDLKAPLEVPALGVRVVPQRMPGAGIACHRVTAAEVRLRTGGERCRLLDGHRHSLKKLLQDRGIPPWERSRVPLFYIDGVLAQVGDLWTCMPFCAEGRELGVRLAIEPLSRTGSGMGVA